MEVINKSIVIILFVKMQITPNTWLLGLKMHYVNFVNLKFTYHLA